MSPKRLCLGLLETDTLYPDLLDDYVSYGTMFRRLFSQQNPDLEFRHYQITEGEFPQTLNECDVYLITGSKAGVYEDLPWISSLQDWIRQAYKAGIPMLGICFGHQVLAQSLGGHAEKSHKGWGVGHQQMKIQQLPGYLSSPLDNYRLIYSHQDQVVNLPAEAHCLAGNDFCPNASWYIGDQVLAFQGHPEFDAAYFRRLITRRVTCIGEQRLNQALEGLQERNDSDTVIRWLVDFIRLPRAVSAEI